MKAQSQQFTIYYREQVNIIAPHHHQHRPPTRAQIYRRGLAFVNVADAYRNKRINYR